MKRSEKLKGKEAVAQKRKQTRLYTGIAIAAIAIVAFVVAAFFLLNSVGAQPGDSVSVYYTGSLDDGTVFDSNLNKTPMTFTLGEGKVIAGFEEAVKGMEPGTTKTVHIPVDKAYGAYKSDLVHVVNRSTLPADNDPVVGSHYTVRRASDGAYALVKVINVTPSTVTWDENHDLAGKDLTFTITVTAIKKK
jgi:peptidylprolyl isomerase